MRARQAARVGVGCVGRAPPADDEDEGERRQAYGAHADQDREPRGVVPAAHHEGVRDVHPRAVPLAHAGKIPAARTPRFAADHREQRCPLLREDPLHSCSEQDPDQTDADDDHDVETGVEPLPLESA